MAARRPLVLVSGVATELADTDSLLATTGSPDTFANLIAANAVPVAGRIVTATDVPDVRVGDGTTHWLDLASSFGVGIFGDGSDGDVVIAGTVTLTRDMYYRNLTVPVSTELKTANFVVYVQNALTWAGTISANGNNASGATGGAAITGRVTSNAGGTGTTGVGAVGLGSSNGLGGNGGAGGSGTPNAGAAATGSSLIAVRGSTRELSWLLSGGNALNGTGQTLQGGASAGSGGGDAINTGGGGGGGGGLVMILARQVVYTSGCIASCLGGNGGNSSAGNTGGGGGGGGGAALVTYLAKVGTLTTQTFTGGTKGTHTGTGVDGGNGTNGSLVERRLV